VLLDQVGVDNTNAIAIEGELDGEVSDEVCLSRAPLLARDG
jgi:hypothetical protein